MTPVTVTMANLPWTRYKVGRPSRRPNWTNADCSPLNTVGHIAHLGDAVRIVEDRMIRASLIWDESCLRKTRMCISWVSPNYWAQSLYGNVRFEFDWPSLIDGKRFYWVEAMTKYNPTAVRLLITTKNYDDSKYLVRFDPSVGDGPIYWDGTAWWWNGDNLTAELMIDDDLRLRDSKSIAFETHHTRICSKGGCSDQDLGADEAASRFIALLLGRRLRAVRNQFTEVKDGSPKQTRTFDRGFGRLMFELREDVNQFSGRSNDDDVVDDIVGAALVAYGQGNEERAHRICSVLEDWEELEAGMMRLTEGFLGFPWRD